VLATGGGFLVLLLSPIPMVRGFGLLLVAGIAIAFALALTLGLALLSITGRGGSRAIGARHSPLATRRSPPTGRPAPRTRSAPGTRSASRERIAAISAQRQRIAARLGALGRRALAVSIGRPGWVLALGLVVAVAGWAAGTRTEVISDLRELVPRDLPALSDVDELQEQTGVSGEVDVTVQAPDLTEPAVIGWMQDLKQRVLDRAGFSDQPTPCREQDAELCPLFAFGDIFDADGAPPSHARARQVLHLLPPYFSQAFIDRDTGGDDGEQTAVIAFGIKVMPFDQQKRLIDSIRSEIDPPGTENDAPAGVSAQVVGLPVLAADANSALEGNRYLLTLAGLAAVALTLLAVYRSPRRALVPLIPIVFAAGWASLGLQVVGVPLNPMSATLGVLVIAIATEFSVLLAARYDEERGRAASVGEALRRAYSRTGVAVLASGITAIAGFAALIATDIRMLRDFGIVTVLDLSMALAGVLLILPAALVWAERRRFAPLRALRARRAAAGPAPGPG
jgi:uncharacterized protein